VERRRSRHPYPEAGQGGVREAAVTALSSRSLPGDKLAK
jgi:hypothetical protein